MILLSSVGFIGPHEAHRDICSLSPLQFLISFFLFRTFKLYFFMKERHYLAAKETLTKLHPFHFAIKALSAGTCGSISLLVHYTASQFEVTRMEPLIFSFRELPLFEYFRPDIEITAPVKHRDYGPVLPALINLIEPMTGSDISLLRWLPGLFFVLSIVTIFFFWTNSSSWNSAFLVLLLLTNRYFVVLQHFACPFMPSFFSYDFVSHRRPATACKNLPQAHETNRHLQLGFWPFSTITLAYCWCFQLSVI
jgi:hypothetical protein